MFVPYNIILYQDFHTVFVPHGIILSQEFTSVLVPYGVIFAPGVSLGVYIFGFATLLPF